MSLSKKPYKGTRDFFPSQQRTQNYLFKKMHDAAAAFGHEPYNGPLLEEVELYKAKSGEELINEQIYSFYDRGQRFVAIRPEMTPTLARMVAQIHRECPKPIRWYSIPNLMRYENPQKGRLREHWQFNCDIFGAPEGQGEAEILQLAIHLMNSFGANETHFEILLNDRHIVEEVFKNLLMLDMDQTYQLYKVVDKSKKISHQQLQENVERLNLPEGKDKIFYDYLNIKNFSDLFTFLEKKQISNAGKSLRLLLDKLEKLSLHIYVKYDATIVRGLDYYTGLVFEIFDKNPDNRRAICGGGAYANLLQIFNEPPLPGIGFGLGDVTLKDFLETHKLLPDFSRSEIDLLLTFQHEDAEMNCLILAHRLRNKGLKVATHFSSIKIQKAFPLAEKKGAMILGFIGENEFKEGKVTLKNLSTQEQQSFQVDNIPIIIKFIDPNS